jgi:hypothetical protein
LGKRSRMSWEERGTGGDRRRGEKRIKNKMEGVRRN